MSVASGIQHALHMRHVVICDLPGSTIFPHIISQTALFFPHYLTSSTIFSTLSHKQPIFPHYLKQHYFFHIISRTAYFFPHYLTNSTIFSTLSHKQHYFFHIISQTALFSIKKVTEPKMCVLIFSTTLPETFPTVQELSAIDQKCISVFMESTRYSCQVLVKLEFSLQISEKYWNIKFHGNPSSGSRVVPYRRTDTTKLIIAFHNFANASKTDYASCIILKPEMATGWETIILLLPSTESKMNSQ